MASRICVHGGCEILAKQTKLRSKGSCRVGKCSTCGKEIRHKPERKTFSSLCMDCVVRLVMRCPPGRRLNRKGITVVGVARKEVLKD